ncbi:interleukin-17 receptor E isoform X2 [Parambassis ranga]|uniref:Interleukin-17 receptor E isoform X2 n=1 Tax=Parambassis ranga TaxID=210632 RepID=A0A6P7IMB7_9TELE|nr:interleukin-17 receptor E-like isoform X2 [Parambassis ranga]
MDVLYLFAMHLGAALAWIAFVVPVLPLEFTTTCRLGNNTDHVEGPVKIVPHQDTTSGYSECIAVHVWMKAEDFCNSPVIKIELTKKLHSFWDTSLRPRWRECKKRGRGKKNCVFCMNSGQFPCSTPHHQWELVHDCVQAKARRTLTVTYSTRKANYSVNYTVPDPKPDFNLSLSQSSKSIIVTVEPGKNVFVRWCYKNAVMCMSDSKQMIIYPDQTPSVVLNLEYLLPCVCVQVYYTYTDANRHEKCLLQNKSLIDVGDVWRSANVTQFESRFTWSSQCPGSDLNISASLCWKLSEHLYIPILDSTLEKKNGPTLTFNTSAVDKHPQMCVQFSLQGSHKISCLFKADEPSWGVYIGPGCQSIVVHLTSSAPAKFSAQLCVLTEEGCVPSRETHTVTVQGNTETSVNIPLHSLAKKPCVQVWQSDPALQGRRILCLDTTHYRRGLYAAAALIFAAIVVFLGIFIHRLTKKGVTGWLYIQRPLLLVCSSDQLAHVSAVCALASILQEELGATVHTALWTQSSQEQSETVAGVADLGPLPWLYGQWEAVCKGHGQVLMFWSPEAKKMYEKWREKRGGYSKTDTAAGKESVQFCPDEDCHLQKEPSTVIELVFMAALACLEGALQGSRGKRAAIVYFQGLGHSRDIPKAFRGVPRYCLPHDFRGLIQELVDIRQLSKTGKYGWPCWPTLLSKVLSIWLARQLTQKLRTLLPQAQSVKKKSNKKHSMLRHGTVTMESRQTFISSFTD